MPFPYFASTDITCCWRELKPGTRPAWERHWLVYGTDYTASPPAKDDTGGTLTLLTELPAEAADILIRRKTPVTQEIELHDNSRLHAKTIEEMADKTTMEIQEARNLEVSKDDLQNLLHEVNDVIKTEKEQRISADDTLDEKIDAETEERKQAVEGAKDYTGEQIAIEEKARDAAIGEAVGGETEARQEADNALDRKIDAETEERESADTALGANKADKTAAQPDIVFGDVPFSVPAGRILAVNTSAVPAVAPAGPEDLIGFVSYDVGGGTHKFGAWTSDGGVTTHFGHFDFIDFEIVTVQDWFNGEVWLSDNYLVKQGIDGQTLETLGSLSGLDIGAGGDISVLSQPAENLNDVRGELFRAVSDLSINRLTRAEFAHLGVKYRDIVDSLDSMDAKKPLSAKQGNALRELVANVNTSAFAGPYAAAGDIPLPYKTNLMYLVGETVPYETYIYNETLGTLIDMGKSAADLDNYYTKAQTDALVENAEYATLDDEAGSPALPAVTDSPVDALMQTVRNCLKWIMSVMAPLDSPVFTGTPKVPNKTGAAAADGTLVATEAQVSLKADTESPALTGTPTAPAPDISDSGTRIATTAFTHAAAKNDAWPVGSFYTQYPETGVSSIADMFPGSTAPATLFGGTWTEMYAGEKVFFMGGLSSVESSRSNGVQEDAIRNITGSMWGRTKVFGGGSGCFSVEAGTSGAPSETGNYATLLAYFDASLVVPTDSTNHPKNRPVKVWRRTA